MNLDYIFPSPIWWVDLDIDLEEMERIVYHVANTMEEKIEAIGGY